MADPVEIILKDVALRRSSEPGYLPESLNRGEPFFQLADGFWLIGDGTSLPSDLPKLPLVSEDVLLERLSSRMTLPTDFDFNLDTEFNASNDWNV